MSKIKLERNEYPILEYNCGADFEWSNPYPLSNSIALTYNQFNEKNNNTSRGEIAVILLNMLS